MNLSDFISVGDNSAFGYSGMWWLNRGDFLKIQTQPMINLEGATFGTFRIVGDKRVLMTRDWLDFSVERLSRYFRMLDMRDQSTVQRMIQILEKFMRKVRRQLDGVNHTASAHTLALVPFYVNPEQALSDKEFKWLNHTNQAATPDDARKRVALVDLYSFAATLLSLWQIGIPRVVVVGNTPTIPLQVQGAFDVFTSAMANMVVTKGESDRGNVMVDMSLNYVMAQHMVSAPDFSHENILMPKHVIENLQQALLHNISSAQALLGEDHDPSHWQFVYFTEPDLLIHTRASALPAITERLQQGYLMAAHRFQPLPHVVDYPMHRWPGELVPHINIHHHNNSNNASSSSSSTGNSPRPNSTIFTDLDADTDACCFIGHAEPARENYPRTCGPWYHCGLDKQPVHGHERLEPYSPLVRLVKQGLGVPLVHEHARVCRPAQRGTCLHHYRGGGIVLSR